MRKQTIVRWLAVAAMTSAAVLAVTVLFPHSAHAAVPGPLGPIDDILTQINCWLAKALQDAARFAGTLLWDVLKLCGMVGLLGDNFSALFGTVVTEALAAVTGGQIGQVIHGSLMVSLGLLGLSLLAKPFWPDLKLVSFQRAALWGIVIQAYLLGAANVYTTLEAFRVDLANEVAGAVSGGGVPGCGGDTVHILLCIAGTDEGEVINPSLTALPDQIAYGGSESVHDLFDHCVYNPAVPYGDPACDADNPVGDPWEVLSYAQEAMGIQVLGLVLAFLIAAYGVLMLALGLAAGMMFILFPVAAIFAFYQPLEGFPAGVVKNYITIFLKSVVLLTLAAVVIRLFTVATGSLVSMAAVALVDLLLCFIMAKEALGTLLGSVSFVGASVSNIGASLGLTGGGGGAAASFASPESRMAAMMVGGGPIAQTLMGAPNPYLMGVGGGGGLLGLPGSLVGAAAGGAQAALQAGTARSALSAALGASGPVGLVAGGAAVAIGALAQRVRDQGAPPWPWQTGATPGQSAGGGSVQPAGPTGGLRSALASTVATSPATIPAAPGRSGATATLAPVEPRTGAPAAIGALRTAGAGNAAGLEGWAPSSARQIENTASRLQTLPPDARDSAHEVIQAGHGVAQDWQADGRPVVQPDGTLDPQFVDESVQRAPAAAGAFALAQQGLPPEQRVRLDDLVALGAATERALPASAVRRGFGRAVKAMGQGHDLDTGLRAELGTGVQGVFGSRAPQAQQVAGQMQQAGLASDLGRQLVETVQDDLGRNPRLTSQRFREAGPGRLARMRTWDHATGDPETTDRIVEGLIGLGAMPSATVYEVPGTGMAAQPPAAPPAMSAPEPTAPAPQAAPQPIPAPAGSTQAAAPAAGGDDTLFHQLRAWRTTAAQQAGRKAFHVLPDAALQEIAARRPATLDELAAVKGVGPRKLQQYGQEILDVVRTTAGQGPHTTNGGE